MKNTVQKLILITLCSLISFYTLADIPKGVYHHSNQIAEKLYYYEHELTTEQKTAIEQLLNKIDQVYAGSGLVTASCGDSATVFQDAYLYAKSTMGYKFHASDAKEIAETISEKQCPALYFNAFKKAYEYGKNHMGYKFFPSDAEKFAYKIADHDQNKSYQSDSLQCFTKNYKFAVDHMGLKFFPSDAKDFAESKCFK